MNLDEALSECTAGARITAPHMQPGCYVEHSFSRGYLRCWPVASASEEPQRTQCDFMTKADDSAADWRILEAAEQYPPKPKLTGGWGVLTPNAQSQEQGRALRKPPVGDVLIVDYASTDAAPRVWALSPKPLDPRKGGW